MARIDVLLPVKNCAPFLAEAIDSVCNQQYTDWRLLVLDHGSTDGSDRIVEQFAERDRRVQLHRLPHLNGLAALLNAGLDLCDAQLVMRHDADDVCFPWRMPYTLSAFARAPNAVAIGSQVELIDARSRTIGALRLPTGAARITAGCFFRNPVCHPSVTFHLAAARRLGVRYGIDFLQVADPGDSMRVDGLVEDYLLFGQLALLGKCQNLPTPLIRYRWHENNVSKLRYREQMALSLRVSRFLARSYSALHHLPYFDPAPFCNHGSRLFDMGAQRDFDLQFMQMQECLQQQLGASEDLSRELHFRRVLAHRTVPRMLARYWRFKRREQLESGEWYTVRSWLLHQFTGRANLPAEP